MAKADVQVKASAPAEETQAQAYKRTVLKTQSDKETAKRLEVLKTVKEEAGKYAPELRGTWLGYTEKSGIVSPALIIAERFKLDGENLSMILTIMVFSPNTAQPYRAELTY